MLNFLLFELTSSPKNLIGHVSLFCHSQNDVAHKSMTVVDGSEVGGEDQGHDGLKLHDLRMDIHGSR